ncbi:MAG: hypothetical protein A4E72_01769 [Syntrophus sp. PtaU1.Bin208]|nr:MAG: hypothetical protein A4E72_01769 [Syntrophus sp. PtaU1.Bin208]
MLDQLPGQLSVLLKQAPIFPLQPDEKKIPLPHVPKRLNRHIDGVFNRNGQIQNKLAEKTRFHRRIHNMVRKHDQRDNNQDCCCNQGSMFLEKRHVMLFVSMGWEEVISDNGYTGITQA